MTELPWAVLPGKALPYQGERGGEVHSNCVLRPTHTESASITLDSTGSRWPSHRSQSVPPLTTITPRATVQQCCLAILNIVLRVEWSGLSFWVIEEPKHLMGETMVCCCKLCWPYLIYSIVHIPAIFKWLSRYIFSCGQA